MSLFVGNISREARLDDIKKDFEKYGSCTFRVKVPTLSLFISLLTLHVLLVPCKTFPRFTVTRPSHLKRIFFTQLSSAYLCYLPEICRP